MVGHVAALIGLVWGLSFLPSMAQPVVGIAAVLAFALWEDRHVVR